MTKSELPVKTNMSRKHYIERPYKQQKWNKNELLGSQVFKTHLHSVSIFYNFVHPCHCYLHVYNGLF